MLDERARYQTIFCCPRCNRARSAIGRAADYARDGEGYYCVPCGRPFQPSKWMSPRETVSYHPPNDYFSREGCVVIDWEQLRTGLGIVPDITSRYFIGQRPDIMFSEVSSPMVVGEGGQLYGLDSEEYYDALRRSVSSREERNLGFIWDTRNRA